VRQPDRHARSLAATAAACAALVLVVVASSAWLRLAAPACPPGGCEGFALADAVRLAHRIAAMGVTVAALVLVALAWKPPARWGMRAAAVLVLLLVAALAIVGRRSAGVAPPAVLLANLLGGLTLLGLAVGLATAARAGPGPVRGAPLVAATILAAAIATGALLATAAPADPAALALVHRGLAWAALVAWGLLALGTGRPRGERLAAGTVAALLAAEAVLAIAAPASPSLRWLHNLLSTAAMCAAIACAAGCGAPSPRAADVPREALARP